MGYYELVDLVKMGVTLHGNNIKISTFTNIYNPTNLIVHDNVRIDDFCVLSCKGVIEIERNVHISAHCFISSSTLIKIGQYSSVSVGSKLFGSCDDFSGNFMVNPTVPVQFTNVNNADIIIKNHVVIGSNSVCLPGVTLNDGVAIGCNSFINKSCESWTIYAGSPIRCLKKRERKCLNLQELYESL